MNWNSAQYKQFWKLSLLAAAILCGPLFANAAENEQVSALFADDGFTIDDAATSVVPPAPTSDGPQLTAFQFEPAPAPPVEGSEPSQSTVPGTPLKSASPMAPAAPIADPQMTEYHQGMADFDMGGYQCGTASCDGCCDCLNECNEPSWTASVGAIYLRRERGDDTPLVRQGVLDANSLNDPVLFNSREFDFEHEVGYVVDVSRHDGMRSFQLRHFGVDGWSDSAIFGPNLAPFTVAFPGFAGQQGTTAMIKYSSQMMSTEANWLGESESRFTPIVGVRWIRFEERLSTLGTFNNSLLNPSFHVDTHNDLYGFQMGGNFLLVDSERFQLSALGKVGVYGNQARHRIKNDDPAVAAFLIPEIEANRSATSMVYETGLNGKLKLTDNISVTGGYMLMWLSQLALAPSQLEQNQISIGTPTAPTAPLGRKHLDTGDYVIVHGGELNLTIEW